MRRIELPNGASTNAVSNSDCLVDVASVDSSGEPVGRRIGTTDHLVDRLESHDLLHGTENLKGTLCKLWRYVCAAARLNLLLGNTHFVLDVGKDGRLDEESLFADLLSAAFQFRSFGLSGFDERHDFVELLLVDLGPLFHVGIERIADGALFAALDALTNEFVVDGIFNEAARTGTATLALIEEEGKVRHFHGVIHCTQKKTKSIQYSTNKQLNSGDRDLQSASAKTMLGLFPPNSKVTFFKFDLPAACMTM